MSYLPDHLIQLPQVAFPFALSGLPLFPVAAFVFAIIAVLQLELLRRTIQFFRVREAQAEESFPSLRLSVELFWTALPLLGTGALALVAYLIWSIR